MFFFKRILKFIIKLIICLFGILKIFYHSKTIAKAKKVFVHNFGSFGHTIVFSDLIRITQKNKNVVLIIFFEDERFNNKLHLLYDFPIIYLPILKVFNFANLKIKIGEVYGPEKMMKNTYLFFIKRLNNKLDFTKNFYRKICKKHYPNIFSFNRKGENLYRIKKKLVHYKLSLNEKPFKLPSNVVETYKNKLDSNRKVCTIYFRYRTGSNQKKDLILRNVNIKIYDEIINLLKNKYQVLIFGDITESNLKKIKNKDRLITYKSLNMDKQLFDIFAATSCDLFIGCEGGAQTLAHYIKNKIHIETYPYGYFPMPYGFKEITNQKLNQNLRKSNIKKFMKKRVMYKKIFYKNKKLSFDYCFKNLWGNFFLNKNYKIKNNEPNEIGKFVKKFI